ncbi:hypothetical protein ACOSQ4_006414 [Xanthoceras sorbifolium]
MVQCTIKRLHWRRSKRTNLYGSLTHYSYVDDDPERMFQCVKKFSSWPTGTFTPAIPSVFSGDNPHQRQQEISHIRQQQNIEDEMIKERKLRSEVWKHFEKDKDRARCNLCKKDFDGSSLKGTTHLRNHYESCQRKKRGGGGDKSDEAAIAIKEKTVVDQQLRHLDTTRIIIKQGITSPNSINAADIMDVYNQEKEKLRKYFEKLSYRYSLQINQVGFYCSYA